jgi:ribose transport system permease protein
MTEVTEKMPASQPEIFRLGRVFERIALLAVWLALIAVYGAAMPQSFLTWGNFAIIFASYDFALVPFGPCASSAASRK